MIRRVLEDYDLGILGRHDVIVFGDIIVDRLVPENRRFVEVMLRDLRVLIDGTEQSLFALLSDEDQQCIETDFEELLEKEHEFGLEEYTSEYTGDDDGGGHAA